jgi:hypothetical protein
MNGVLVRIYKEVVMTYFKVQYQHLLEETKQNHKNSVLVIQLRSKPLSPEHKFRVAGCDFVDWIYLATDRVK